MKLSHYGRSNINNENCFKISSVSVPFANRKGWVAATNPGNDYCNIYLPGQKLAKGDAPTVHITVPDDDEAKAFYNAACAGGPNRGELGDCCALIHEEGNMHVFCSDYSKHYFNGDEYALEHALYKEVHPSGPNYWKREIDNTPKPPSGILNISVDVNGNIL